MSLLSYLGEISAVITIVGALLATSQRFRALIRRSLQGPDVKSVINRPFKYREVHRGLVHLSRQARDFGPDLLVGINRGGAILGGMIGKRLGMIVRILEVTHRPEDPVWLAVNDKLLVGKRVLLVDDRLRTGTNMARARDYLQQRGANVYCMVFARPEGWTELSLPQEFAYHVSAPDLPFPWEPGSSKEWK